MIEMNESFEINGINYLLTTDKDKINFDSVYSMLSNSYWAKKRSKETIIKSTENSITFSLYSDNEQIGFARIVTDYTTMFYLFDVIIKDECRRKGIGKKMLSLILAEKPFADIKGFLNTNDAQELYKKFGFSFPEVRNNFMWKIK